MYPQRALTSVIALCFLLIDITAAAQAPLLTGTVGDSRIAGNGTKPGADGKFEISANGIRAYFVPYGASITNLIVNDTHGVERDIIVGYDHAYDYSSTHVNRHLGGVTGRYTNRIANASFVMDGMRYNTTKDDGNSTLHSAVDGWDSRNWTIVAHTTDSITFSIAEPGDTDGFPGKVVAYVTHTVVDEPRPRWLVRMVALSLTETSPIMLASRAHWNLDGFSNPETPTILNHTLSLPFSGQRVNVDPYLVPDGLIAPNTLYSVNDFWSYSGKQIGKNFTRKQMDGNCGQKCHGYDNCYLINRDAGKQMGWWMDKGPVATLRSKWSHIRLNVYTDQSAVQLYTCNSMDGTLPLKTSQGLKNNYKRPRVVEKYGCVGLEFEDWVGGINNPEWGRQPKQQFGPGDAPYVLQAAYEVYASTPTPHCTSRTVSIEATSTPSATAKAQSNGAGRSRR